MAEIGLVKLVEGPWNDEYVAELGLFPKGTYADQVDATSRMLGRMLLVQELDLPTPPIVVNADSLQGNNVSVSVHGKSVSSDGFSISVQELVAGSLADARDGRYGS